MATIKRIRAREILSSNGMPTVEAEVILDNGISGKASVPYGASAGSHEAVTIFDGDENRYEGKGMLKVVEKIEGEIDECLEGEEVGGQQLIDLKMINLDGTENKSRLGGNSILAVSLACARAGAVERGIPLYQYLGETFGFNKFTLPKPMVVMIEGGKHANNSSDIQEYLVTCLKDVGIAKNIEIEREIYEKLVEIFDREGLSTTVGNEGALTLPNIGSNEKPLEYLIKAIEEAGYEPGVEVGLSIDAAASEFYNEGKYYLSREKKKFDGETLIKYYLPWLKKYPIVTTEDMLAEDDWDSWAKWQQMIGGVINIGDDLTTTNRKRLKKAIDWGAIGGIIIKPNQAGTITETMETVKLAETKGMVVVPSHRGGGETGDTFLSDLAVAVGANFIKVGITRGERVEKYNRLMEIEQEMVK